MHLDSCKDRVIEEVRRYRFNEPIPGWHGDIRNPSHFGSEDIQRYEEAAAFDVRQPAPNARPSRMSLVTRPLPRGEPIHFKFRGLPYMTSALRGVSEITPILRTNSSDGGGSKNPKILRTPYMEAPLPFIQFEPFF